MARGGGSGRGGPMHGGMPHMPSHHFQNQNYGQPQQQSGWRFSWMNIIPIYTLCIVGYAIYIYFKVKNKTPEEREKRRGGIQKTELGELKERLAKTEAALTKLMEATNMISEKMNPDDLQKLFGDQKIIEELLKKEEKRIEDEEKENKPTEEKSIKTDEKSDDKAVEKSDEPVENKDEKSAEQDIPEDEIESSEPVEENITSKTVEDSAEDSSVRQRKPKAESDLVVETIGQTEREVKKDVVENDAEQTVDLENKKTE